MQKKLIIFSIFLYGWSPLISSHFPPWLSWHGESLSFLSIFIFAWMQLFYIQQKKDEKVIAVPAVAMVVIAIGLVVIIQGQLDVITYSGDIWIFLFYAFLCLICIVVGFNTPDGQKIADCNAFALVAWTLLAGAAVSTAIAFCQLFSLMEHVDWITRMTQVRRPGGNLAQPNNLATFQIMAIGSVIYLSEAKKLGKLGVYFLLGFLCIGLAMTESRAGAGGIFLLMIWWAVYAGKSTGHASLKASVITFISFAILFLSWPAILNSLMLTDQAIVSTTSSSRIKIWSELFNAVMLHPWQGWGAREVFKAQSALAENYPASSAFTYSHNIILDLILWFGLPIGLALTVIFAWWAWLRIKEAKTLQSWYAVAVIIPVVFHSLFEFPYSYAYIIAPAMFMAGALERQRKKISQFLISRKLVLGFMAISSAALLWSVREYVVLEEKFRASRFESAGIGPEQKNSAAMPIIFLTQLDALTNAARVRPVRNMTSDELLLLKNAVLHYPWPELQFRYALALALNNDLPESKRQLKIARNLYGENTYDWMRGEFFALGQHRYPELRGMP